MGSSSSSQYTSAAATHPSDVRRMSAAQRITTQLSPTHHDSRRQSHPGNATAAYAVPVMVPVRLPPQPPQTPRQYVPPAIHQFSRQNSWNETRDLTFCRILGAEEFLGRMLEQDDLLRHLSQRDNREELTPQIVETLGLRGHLQGELVRIERMLAENDPELKNIATYEISNAAVVEVLREIRDEAKRLRDSEMQTEVTTTTEGVNQANRKSMGTDTTEQGMGGSMTSLGVQTNNDGRFGMYGSVGVNGHSSIANGTSVREGGRSPGGGDAGLPNGLHGSRGVGVGVDGFNDSDRLRDVATETDLEQLHKQEELELAEKFAGRIAGGPRQLSSDEVNEVLGDHAKSVQALKRRHDLDRQKLLRRLEQRKLELEHRNNNSVDDDDDDNDDDKQLGKMRRKKGDEGVSRGKELGELVDENARTMTELKRVKDLEKQRIQEMLKRKQQGLTKVVSEDEEEEKEGSHEQSRVNPKDPGNEETSSLNRRAGEASSNDPGLEEVVRTLESMRLSGELSEETMTNILRQYNKSRMNEPSEKEEEEGEKEGEDHSGRKNKRNKKQPKQDDDATRDAVQRLVQDNQLTMEEIQRQRSKEKELIERKLKLKLGSKTS